MLRSLFSLALVSASLAVAQTTPSCIVTAVTPTVRAEGVTERTGDIVLSCTAAPGTSVTGNLTIFLNTGLTNRDFADGTIDAALTVNGALANAQLRRSGSTQATANGLQLVFGATGQLAIRISNLRADATYGGSVTQIPAQFGGGTVLPGTAITANLAFSPAGLLSFNVSQVRIGIPQRTLFATSQQTFVASQIGSTLPDQSLTFTNALAARTFFSSTRITEGFATGFEPRQPGNDTGTRIILRFSGYPSDARLFVPALIAGSSAATPTAAGDFGGSISPGVYNPGSGTLALLRIQSTDPGGAGGFQSAPVSNDLTEVTLTNGSGIAVYEVLDANPQVSESAQIPVFLGLPRSVTPRNASTAVEVNVGPVSSQAYPRFVQVAAATDCTLLGDCGTYVPKLRVIPAANTFRLVQGGVAIDQFLLYNDGGGRAIPFTTRVEYQDSSDWIRLDVDADIVARPVRMSVFARPQMAVGTYKATVVIDAGPAGVARFPITLEVVAAPPQPPQTPTPRIGAVVNGATFEAGPVARNSYYTITGENLAGNNVTVTFDGKPAKIVFSGPTQINFLVPADLAANSAQLVVTVSGTASVPVRVQVQDAYPGIFPNGILNQDGTLNSPSNPAIAGTFLQIYATGLLGPAGQGVVDAKLHDVMIPNPPYAGPAPGIDGMQQVNLQVPLNFPTMTTEVVLCTTATGTRICSSPAKVHVRQAP